MSFLAPVISRVSTLDPIEVTGTIASLRGLTLMVDELPARVGTIVDVHTGHTRRPGASAVSGRARCAMSLATSVTSPDSATPISRKIAVRRCRRTSATNATAPTSRTTERTPWARRSGRITRTSVPHAGGARRW